MTREIPPVAVAPAHPAPFRLHEGRDGLSPEMVGREPQMEELRGHFRAASEGRGRIVFVLGDAGVGKSRLVREFAAALEARDGVDVVAGRCYDQEHPDALAAFFCVVQAIVSRHGLERAREAAGAWAGDLARLVPEVADAAAECSPRGAAAGRMRLFEAVRRVVRPWSPGGCRVVLLEDVQWLDPSSRELVEFLADGIADERVLVVATCRTGGASPPAPLGRLLERLRRGRRYHAVHVGSLTRDDTGAVLQAIVGRFVPGRIRDAVFERSEGNPFFVEEILLALRDRGRLAEFFRRAEQGEPLDPLEVPSSLRAGIQARVDELEPRTAEVLRYAAVAGRCFPFELLQQLCGYGEAELLRALDTLVGHQLVVETPDGSPDCYGFRQSQIRDVVYHGLLGRDRRRRHREILEALERTHASRPDEVLDQLARHSVLGGVDASAAAYCRAAGERAARMHAYREAIAHFEAAAAALGEEAPRERAALFERLGEAAYPTGDVALCSRYLREAERLYAGLGDRLKVGDMHRRLAEAWWQGGDGPAASSSLGLALEVLEPEAASRELVMALVQRAAFLLLDGDPDQSVLAGRKALEIARKLDDPEGAGCAMNWVGCALVELGSPGEGIALLRESLHAARRAGAVGPVIRAYSNLGANLASLGHFREAAEVLRDGVGFADATGWGPGRGRITANLGAVEMELGHWGRAGELFDRAIRDGGAWYSALRLPALLHRADLLLRTGSAGEALELLQRTLGECGDRVDPRTLRTLYSTLARVRLALGDAEGAVEDTHRCMAACQGARQLPADPRVLGCAVEVYARAGLPAQAQKRLGTLAGAVARMPGPLGAACLEDALGSAAPCPAAAAAHFGAAAAGWARMGLVFQEARSRFRRGEALAASGTPRDRGTAAAELSSAAEAFGGLGAALDRERACGALDGLDAARGGAPDPALAADAGTSTGPPGARVPGRAAADGLSRRELEILRSIAAGKSNGDIARQSFVTVGTVKTHTHHIYAKLGVRSRTQAVARARELGLLTP